MNVFKKTIATILSLLLALTYPVPRISMAGNDGRSDQERYEELGIAPDKWTAPEKKSQMRRDFRDFFNAPTLSKDEKKKSAKAKYQEHERNNKGEVSLRYAMAGASRDHASVELIDLDRIKSEDIKAFRKAEFEQAIIFVTDDGPVFAIHKDPNREKDETGKLTGKTPMPSETDKKNAVYPWEAAGNANGWTAYDREDVVSEELPDTVILGRIHVLKSLYGAAVKAVYVTSGDVDKVRAHELLAVHLLENKNPLKKLRDNLNQMVVKFDALKAAQKTLGKAVGGEEKGVLLRAGVQIGGTAHLTPDLTRLPNFPEWTVGGKYISPVTPTPGGLQYRYDVRHSIAHVAYATIQSSTGEMNLGALNFFNFNMQIEPANLGDNPPVTAPATVRVRLTDRVGNIIEVDAESSGIPPPPATGLKGYSIDLNLDPNFQKAHVVKIDFLQSQAISGNNRRANVKIFVRGLLDSVATVPGTTPGLQPTQLPNYPGVSHIGQYISPFTGGEAEVGSSFHYVYDVRSSPKNAAIFKILNLDKTMDIAGGVLKINLKVIRARERGSNLQPGSLQILARVTDKNGRVVAKLLDVTGTMEEFAISLPISEIDSTNIQSIELVQNNLFIGGFSSTHDNRRAEIVGEIGGLASAVTGVAGAGIAVGDEPSKITNYPAATTYGSYITKKELASGDGVSYQFDVRHSTRHEAVMKLESENGHMGIPNSFKLQMMVEETVNNSVTIGPTDTVRVMIKFTDMAGNIFVKNADVKNGALLEYAITIPPPPDFDATRVKTIEFIHSSAVDNKYKRAKMTVMFGGATAETTLVGFTATVGDPVTNFANNDPPPIALTKGKFITQIPKEGGVK